ncbi:hypothetical protein PMAYCL1PPCAC_28330, partial [Pristionchus mayeri]
IVRSQSAVAFKTLNPCFSPHTLNYKFVGPANSSLPIEFTLNRFDNNSVASVTISQKGKVVGIAHFRAKGDFPVESRSIKTDDLLRTALWMRVRRTVFYSLHPADSFAVSMFFSESTMLVADTHLYQRAGIKI